MKRLTETEKWRDPWFRKLPDHYKLLWIFLCDNCNLAGVWDPDFDALPMCINALISADQALVFLKDRITVLPNGKWAINKFINFQYGELRNTNPYHVKVLKVAKESGLLGAYIAPYAGAKQGAPGAPQELRESIGTGTDPEGGMGGERPSRTEVILYADKIGLAPWKAEDWFHEMEGCGWLDHLQRPVMKWQPILNRVKVKWEADGRPTAPPSRGSNGTQPSGVGTVIALRDQRAALVRQIEQHPANPQFVGYNAKCTELEKTDLRNKRRQLKEIDERMTKQSI